MRTTIGNSLFRSDKYCEIPSCKQKSNKLTQSQRLISPKPIEQKLSCGCYAFEYKSHLNSCKFHIDYPKVIGNFGISPETIEDQPYYPGCLS